MARRYYKYGVSHSHPIGGDGVIFLYRKKQGDWIDFKQHLENQFRTGGKKVSYLVTSLAYDALKSPLQSSIGTLKFVVKEDL